MRRKRPSVKHLLRGYHGARYLSEAELAEWFDRLRRVVEARA